MQAVVGEAAEVAAALLPSCEKGFSCKISFRLISSSCLTEVISIVKKHQQFPGALVTQLGLCGGDRVRCGCCASCWWPRGGGSAIWLPVLGFVPAALGQSSPLHFMSLLGTGLG